MTCGVSTEALSSFSRPVQEKAPSAPRPRGAIGHGRQRCQPPFLLVKKQHQIERPEKAKHKSFQIHFPVTAGASTWLPMVQRQRQENSDRAGNVATRDVDQASIGWSATCCIGVDSLATARGSKRVLPTDPPSTRERGSTRRSADG